MDRHERAGLKLGQIFNRHHRIRLRLVGRLVGRTHFERECQSPAVHPITPTRGRAGQNQCLGRYTHGGKLALLAFLDKVVLTIAATTETITAKTMTTTTMPPILTSGLIWLAIERIGRPAQLGRGLVAAPPPTELPIARAAPAATIVLASVISQVARNRYNGQVLAGVAKSRELLKREPPVHDSWPF